MVVVVMVGVVVVVVCYGPLNNQKSFYTNVGWFSDDVIKSVESTGKWHRNSRRRQRALPERLASVWTVLEWADGDNGGRGKCSRQAVDERVHHFRKDKE